MKIELPVKRTVVEETPDDELMVRWKLSFDQNWSHFKICEFCDQEFTSGVLFRIHKKAHANEHNYNITSAGLLAEEKAKDLQDDADSSQVKDLLWSESSASLYITLAVFHFYSNFEALTNKSGFWWDDTFS